MSSPTADRPVLAWGVLVALAAAKLALHTVSSAWRGYGFTPDELYFLDCADRLDWGYVDHPPASILLLELWRSGFGESLVSLRLLAALLGAVAILLTGALAREMGGGRGAQALAAVALLVSPTVLYVGGYYSMNGVDVALWTLAVYLLVRIGNGASPAVWLGLGLVLAVGLLNKHSTLWLAAGLGVGLLLSRERRWLATPWPWAAAAIAVAAFTPHLAWQMRHDWPTLEFMQNGMREVMVRKSSLDFLREQIRSLHPVSVPLAAAGLVWLFASSSGRRYAMAGWIFVVTVAILLASGTARPYYLAPAYPIVLAAGSVALEHATGAPRWRWIPAAYAVLILAAGAVSAPLIVPLLAPERVAAYEEWLGTSRPKTEFAEGRLPVQFGLQFGWDAIAQAVAEAHHSLPLVERQGAGVLAFRFPDAAAVSRLGGGLGLPPVSGTHNNYWLWGPPAPEISVFLALAVDEMVLRRLFEAVEKIGPVRCDLCTPELQATAVYLCRRPRRPLAEVWPELKNYS